MIEKQKTDCSQLQNPVAIFPKSRLKLKLMFGSHCWRALAFTNSSIPIFFGKISDTCQSIVTTKYKCFFLALSESLSRVSWVCSVLYLPLPLERSCYRVFFHFLYSFQLCLHCIHTIYICALRFRYWYFFCSKKRLNGNAPCRAYIYLCNTFCIVGCCCCAFFFRLFF